MLLLDVVCGLIVWNPNGSLTEQTKNNELEMSCKKTHEVHGNRFAMIVTGVASDLKITTASTAKNDLRDRLRQRQIVIFFVSWRRGFSERQAQWCPSEIPCSMRC